MMAEHERIHTAIDPKLLTRTLARGCVVGGLGIAMILAAAVELDVSQMPTWGVAALIIGIVLVALGWLPYKSLSKRRARPDELMPTEEALIYSQEGTLTLTIPLDSISRVSHIDQPPLYGVALELKEHPEERVRVHTRDYDVHRIRHHAKRKFGVDLYFPYFTHAAFQELRRALAEQGYSDEP
jgi:hypothetical protein